MLYHKLYWGAQGEGRIFTGSRGPPYPPLNRPWKLLLISGPLRPAEVPTCAVYLFVVL